METTKFPTIRKEWSRFLLDASHDLRGVTTHPDAMLGKHSHSWLITLVFEGEYNPRIGFQRDEHAISLGWGERIDELQGEDLSALMKLPATAENFAYWLLYYWLVRPSGSELNFEISAVRVTKDGHSSEVRRTAANRRGWEAFGGEVA